MKHAPYPGTQAVLRAVSVLKAVADHGPESRLSDLARQVGLNKTTVFRLLSALESAEMIERTPSGSAYRLGPALLRLSSQAPRKAGPPAAAPPPLPAPPPQTRGNLAHRGAARRRVLSHDDAPER